MKTDIVETIQSRLEAMGMSQAQFAEFVSTTPAQIGIFLKGKGSLSTESLNKSLDLVGVDLSLYSKRNSLAKKVASHLCSKNVNSIDNWTKEDLATFTHQHSILLLFDVNSEKEYIELKESGIVDIESTFPYFKALVSYHMILNGNKPTASQAKQALTTIHKDSKDHYPDIISKQADNIAAAAIGTVALANPIIGMLALVYKSTKIAGLAAGKQIGALTLFSKLNAPSLFTKALDFIKK